MSFAIGRINSEQELVANWRFILAGPAFFSILRIFGLYVAWVYKSKGHGKPGIESVKWIMEKYWDKETSQDLTPELKN